MKTPTDGPNGRRILVFTRIVLARGTPREEVHQCVARVFEF
jgi:hypothetical protein